MAEAYTGILIRIFAYNEARQCYPVEAEIDDGSHFDNGELRLDQQKLLQYELNPETYGMSLFEALFKDEIARAYEKAQNIAEAKNGGRLRVRLWLDEDAVELHAVRWERLYQLQKGKHVPLAASAQTPFSRYTSLEIQEPKPIAELPIRMLVAVSNPKDLPEGMAAVDVVGEIENLRKSISGLVKSKKLQVRIMPGVTGLPDDLRLRLAKDGMIVIDGAVNLASLQSQLAQAHIFHFVGHGMFRRKSEQGTGHGALYLEKPDGNWEAVRDDNIVSTLVALGSLPQCIFLTACESAKREVGAESPFVGLGPKLVQAGVPAVVAMQDRVSMEAARIFEGEFYSHLSEHGEVDRALNQARLQVLDKKLADWDTAVLFMRIRSGRLFGKETEAGADGERVVKWWPIAIGLGLIGLLLTAILWFVIPKKDQIMTGQFNVAVAEFVVQDGEGKTIRSEDGSLLANYIQQQIETQFSEIELNKTIPYSVWGPKETGAIAGNTAQARSSAAAKLAEKIHAHVLIYGVIVSDGTRSRFMPEFYVNHASFQDASEITGEHKIGSQVRLALPFIDSIQAVENPALAGRVNAMDLITIGLAYYSVDDFENAALYLEKAAAEKRWLETSGKEVVYLLIGNTYIRWASRDDNAQYVPEAARNYAEALRINPDYGRGLVGQANVLYLEALGSLDKPQIDPVKLDQADALVTQALALQGQPESANIAAKAHFNRGQIDLARYKSQVPVIPGGDWIAQAKNEFTFVIDEYEAGNTTLKPLASHAYFRLGECIFYRDLMDPQAILLIEKAISIASPFYQAEYTALLGNLYNARGEPEKAIQAYEDAIAIAESNGDADSALKYQKNLDKLLHP